MQPRTRTLIPLVLLAAALAAPDAAPAAAATIRYALGDVVSVDELPLLIAAERARARGVEVAITSFKSEELATQAVINGQADVGQGTPYAAVQRLTRAPLRFFYQLSALQFFPVVSREHYQSWKDLDGQEIVVHARGSGTEAIMQLMAKTHGITFKNVSYVPGSDVRALGLLRGTIKATILDATNKNYVMKEAADKFLILPVGEVKASDEALFATRDYLQKQGPAVSVLVEELIRVSRDINANPAAALEERKRLGLLKDLPPKLEGEILPFYQEAVANGVFPPDGGGERAAKNDLEFFALAGQLKGEPLRVEDFWDLEPLRTALARAGR